MAVCLSVMDGPGIQGSLPSAVMLHFQHCLHVGGCRSSSLFLFVSPLMHWMISPIPSTHWQLPNGRLQPVLSPELQMCTSSCLLHIYAWLSQGNFRHGAELWSLPSPQTGSAYSDPLLSHWCCHFSSDSGPNPPTSKTQPVGNPIGLSLVYTPGNQLCFISHLLPL